MTSIEVGTRVMRQRERKLQLPPIVGTVKAIRNGKAVVLWENSVPPVERRNGD